MSYLNELNQEQYHTVIHTQGPCMVIAGAGSGKTKILTCRTTHLIAEKKVNPATILVLTFTNKAAKEMEKRIQQLAGMQAKNLWMGTFHSIFFRILRIEAHRLGYPSNFSIYDNNDSKSLLKTIIKEMALDDKIYKPATVLGRISGAKNRLIHAQSYAADFAIQEEDKKSRREQMGAIFLKYQARCFKAGAMDFDDLLLNIYTLFTQYPVVLHKLQQQFHYILIDEFQDTNLVQYTIVQKLAALHKNIFVVGDDAQSIYAFRGAEINNILQFSKHYPNLQTIKLEQNYRSTQTIVNAANTLIAHNQSQLSKNVWTNNEKGDLIQVVSHATDLEEGRFVAISIAEMKKKYGSNNQDFAILYRTNSQSRAIEEALRKKNITYRILGGMSFYQRKEVKDLLAYLRLINNHHDEEALKRIINFPARGISVITMQKVTTLAIEYELTLWEILYRSKEFFSNRVTTAIMKFVHFIQEMASLSLTHDVYFIAKMTAQHGGLLKLYAEDKTLEGKIKYEHIQELLNGIQSFVEHEKEENKTLAYFLQEIALITSLEEDSATIDAVRLMTVHAAKGLEFTYVYIVGLEEELFPSAMMLNSVADIEEERRLFYVALTRAQKKIFCTYAFSRYRFGSAKSCSPSRFIREIDPVYIQTTIHHDKHIRKPTRITKFSEQTQQISPHLQSLQVGMQVKHPTFGQGRIMQIIDEKSHPKVQVNFIRFGKKILLLHYSKLICDTNNS